jgi:hypothetical protein
LTTIPQEPEQSQQPEQQKWFDIRRRRVWVVAFLAAFVIVMAIGASMPMSPAEAKTIYNQLQNGVQYTDTVDMIFGHNFFLTMIMFTPFVGPIFGVFSSFSTRFALEAIAIKKSVSTGLLFGSLFLYPHVWLELIAYSLAMSQSVFLAIAMAKGRFRKELVRTCVIVTVCALILLLVAVFEVIVIFLGG